MMAKDLSIKDSLLLKEKVEFKDFKSKLDIYSYRNNFDFEGTLIQQSFFENYEFLMKQNEELKNSEFELKQQLLSCEHTLESLKKKYNQSCKSITEFTNLKKSLVELREPLIAGYRKADSNLQELLKSMVVYKNLLQSSGTQKTIENPSIRWIPPAIMSQAGILATDEDCAIIKKLVFCLSEVTEKYAHIQVNHSNGELREYKLSKEFTPPESAGLRSSKSGTAKSTRAFLPKQRLTKVQLKPKAADLDLSSANGSKEVEIPGNKGENLKDPIYAAEKQISSTNKETAPISVSVQGLSPPKSEGHLAQMEIITREQSKGAPRERPSGLEEISGHLATTQAGMTQLFMLIEQTASAVANLEGSL